LIVKDTFKVVKALLLKFLPINWSKIVDMLRKLFFTFIYYQKPVWDTGISPPELLNFIASHSPGTALDMGCGTGTNVITLAKAGWKSMGVDFAPQAIHLAKKKAKHNGVSINLRVGDVTRLDYITDSFDLILDIGCFHSLPPPSHKKYIRNIDRLLSSNGTYLLYAFIKNLEVFGPGATEDDLTYMSKHFQLINRQDGTDRGIRPSAWLTYQKFK
jgi:2-polyprenyl-3-methyl-5-hydroxy-6-metoxy-1,4-benzoquinol methylase